MVPPSTIIVELRWGATSQQLLLVRVLHLDTESHRDLSVFQRTAWCTQPELVPLEINLLITGTPMPMVEWLSVKRILSNPISIAGSPPPAER
jgi:hypothetical protein